MQKPDIHRLIELQKLLLAFSHVERKVYRKHKDTYIYENDTEHSYNLAMTAWYLAKWFPSLDRETVIKVGLAHDFVEIYAGDTYIYASKEELATKKEREQAALERLLQEWPDFDDIFAAINAYESKDSNEAKFVYALDKIMPIIAVYINDGHSWKEQDITVKMLHSVKNGKVSISPEVVPYYDALMEILIHHPEVIRPR
ncbi:MAG: HD domain-containing protein [Candidatus Saccharimonadales bacterium]